MADLTPDNRPQSTNNPDAGRARAPNEEYLKAVGAKYFANLKELLATKDGRAEIMSALEDEPDLMWEESAEWITLQLEDNAAIILKSSSGDASLHASLLEPIAIALCEGREVLVKRGKNFALASADDTPDTLETKLHAHATFLEHTTRFVDVSCGQDIFNPEKLKFLTERFDFDLLAKHKLLSRELERDKLSIMRVSLGESLDQCFNLALAAAEKFRRPVVFTYSGNTEIVTPGTNKSVLSMLAGLRKPL